jgi:hypothetical protein
MAYLNLQYIIFETLFAGSMENVLLKYGFDYLG